MSFVAELEPRTLWGHFDEILRIPRASKDEAKARDYVIGVAKRCGLKYQGDDTGNVVVHKPASPGHEQAPITILQSHLDMVEEKNSDVDHDFRKDAIKPRREGEYLKATGTTLGADNGIGVASMLAIMEAKDLTHGPLELLFTVDEETGLTGAGGLADNMLQGRQLLNLDSEEEGILTIGCAGGADAHLFLPVIKKAAPAGSQGLTIRLFGLKGGHSGCDIHLQRGNAIKLLARVLHGASLDHGFHLAEIAGGNAHNAIPREAGATVVVSDLSKVGDVRATIEAELQAIRAEYRPAEPDMQWTLKESATPKEVYDESTTAKVLALVDGLPHGVMAMCHEMPGLVETSTNLAVVGEADGRFKVLMSSRSSVDSALRWMRRHMRALAALAGADVQEKDGYPGWKPDVDSHLLKVVKAVYQDIVGSTPEVSGIHAGLECGIIGEKYSGMDMISFGPQIEFPHSPDECVKIDTVGRFHDLLCGVLKRLA